MNETRITQGEDWLLLIASVAGPNGSLRLRFWRQVKSLGAAILRDGVYLLPARPDLQNALDGLRAELVAAGGNAWLLRQPAQEAALQAEWTGLFDRGEAYAEWRAELGRLLEALPGLAETEALRQLRQQRKALEALVAIDYFPGDARLQAETAWLAARDGVTRHYSPDEPLPSAGAIPLLDRAAYRGRRWATRRRPWVDRVASAWLIRRFIDPSASFVWLADAGACPGDALGFDFDGAAFTHVGDKVSFEVLMASFGLDADPALARLATMVHALDVGTDAAPEAVGFEAILTGARDRIDDDDALLEEMGGMLDSLYAYYRNAAHKTPRNDLPPSP